MPEELNVLTITGITDIPVEQEIGESGEPEGEPEYDWEREMGYNSY